MKNDFEDLDIEKKLNEIKNYKLELGFICLSQEPRIHPDILITYAKRKEDLEGAAAVMLLVEKLAKVCEICKSFETDIENEKPPKRLELLSREDRMQLKNDLHTAAPWTEEYGIKDWFKVFNLLENSVKTGQIILKPNPEIFVVEPGVDKNGKPVKTITQTATANSVTVNAESPLQYDPGDIKSNR